VVKTLAADLRRLDDWWARACLPGRPRTASSEPPAVDYPKPPRPGGVFLVAGPLSDDSLLRLIEQLGAHVSGLESCTSPDRWKSLAAEALPSAKTVAGVSDLRCPRRPAPRDRHVPPPLHRRPARTPGPPPRRDPSVVHRLRRQSFCDPGAYDALLVSQMAGERGLPYLEIEVDFPFDANGRCTPEWKPSSKPSCSTTICSTRRTNYPCPVWPTSPAIPSAPR